MTAIYAFAQRTSERALIATDDREYNTGARVDKLNFLFERFAVAVYGSDALDYAINGVGYFDGVRGHSKPEDVAALVEQLATTLVVAARHLVPLNEQAVAAGHFTEDLWQKAQRHEGHVVVLDTKDFRLYDVAFGRPYARGGLLQNPVIQELGDGVLWRFALARQLGGAYEPLRSPRPDMRYLEQLMNADRRRLNIIGGLGAVITVEAGQIVRTSAFRNPTDRLDELYKRTPLAPSITLVCADPSHQSEDVVVPSDSPDQVIAEG